MSVCVCGGGGGCIVCVCMVCTCTGVYNITCVANWMLFLPVPTAPVLHLLNLWTEIMKTIAIYMELRQYYAVSFPFPRSLILILILIEVAWCLTAI